MDLPIKSRTFYDGWETFLTAYPMAGDIRLSTPIDFEKYGKRMINEALIELLPHDFWMITSARKGAYMVYILDKEKVLDAMGLNRIMEYFT
jgi:hypothetical protein